MIIDFQKQFIVEQSNSGQHAGMGYYNNECIIEEADNEEDTENEAQNSTRKYEDGEGESDDEVVMRSSELDILRTSQKDQQNYVYPKQELALHDKRANEQGHNEFSLGDKEMRNNNYDSKDEEDSPEDINRQYSSDNDMFSEDQEMQEEPVVNKTLVMLQKDLHKSLFSPSLMKINESPKVSLMTDRSK